MITVYTVQQGELEYDDNFYQVRSAEFGKVAGQFLKLEEAQELKQKLINFTYNILKDKLDLIEFHNHFLDHKYPTEVEEYEKLYALEQDLEAHVTITTYDLDDSHIVHPDNKSPYKWYCRWCTEDADIVNKQRKEDSNENLTEDWKKPYLDMDYDNPEYESILEQIMDIAERRLDAGNGFSWYNIEYAWDEFLEYYNKK